MRFLLILIFILTASDLRALPPCLDSKDNVSEVQRYLKTKDKYRGYIEVFQKNKSESQEILRRLVYAETMATGAPCKPLFLTIAPWIAAAISNRIEKRSQTKEATLSVVFQKDQFASSLHAYPQSRLSDFLCPRDTSLWDAVDAAVSKKTATLPSDTVHYYLYQHHPQWTPPSWTKTYKKTAAPGLKELESCIGFFENSAWQ